ncbi:MAG: hypothetical protein PHI32_05760 [Dysgonamonadaceae bacterium]|nr:hypothetical protein [Dysgonamonadaceae bacterium]
MTKAPDLTLAKQEESTPKLRKRSLLEVLNYHLLIDELEEHLITNKKPFLLKTAEELKEYPEILHYLSLDGSTPKNDKDRCYFHLEGVEVEPNSENRKYTAEDNMHKNIQLTIVYWHSAVSCQRSAVSY